jgi:hypothetical protein
MNLWERRKPRGFGRMNLWERRKPRGFVSTKREGLSRQSARRFPQMKPRGLRRSHTNTVAASNRISTRPNHPVPAPRVRDSCAQG